ncbi:MAG TPA: phosphatase PAP2 family protein [Chitinophagales bacterium]|nr:phosphatase PAP2 family protein [Chitinophagales bacterium]
MRKIPLLLLSLVSITALSQNIYHLSYKLDIPAGAAGVGTLTTSYFLSRTNHAPTLDELPALSKDDVWKFDRSATGRWSPPSAKASDVLWVSSMAMPGLLLINKHVRRERYVSLLYAESMLLTMGVTSLFKEITHRYRPYVYNDEVDDTRKTEKDAARSFFSGHASLSATATFFMATVYSDLNPGSNLKPLVWASVALLPAVTGLLRYFAGKHYPTDIIIGYVVGGAVGFFVPYLHKKIDGK